MMKKLLTTIISGFLFVSASAFAADYSQTQNKVDDKMNSPAPAQAKPDDKSPDKDSNKVKDIDSKGHHKSSDDRHPCSENKSESHSHSGKMHESKSSSDSQKSGSQNSGSTGTGY